MAKKSVRIDFEIKNRESPGWEPGLFYGPEGKDGGRYAETKNSCGDRASQ